MHRFSVMKKEFLCGFIKDVDERAGAGGGRGAVSMSEAYPREGEPGRGRESI